MYFYIIPYHMGLFILSVVENDASHRHYIEHDQTIMSDSDNNKVVSESDDLTKLVIEAAITCYQYDVAKILVHMFAKSPEGVNILAWNRRMNSFYKRDESETIWTRDGNDPKYMFLKAVCKQVNDLRHKIALQIKGLEDGEFKLHQEVIWKRLSLLLHKLNMPSFICGVWIEFRDMIYIDTITLGVDRW